MIYRDLYMRKILPFVDTPFVKIITGIRRCGKSTILKMIQEKFFIADPSLKYSVLGYNPNGISTTIENIAFIELSARGYTVHVGKLDDFEINFIATKPNYKIYIQVTYSINSPVTEERE